MATVEQLQSDMATPTSTALDSPLGLRMQGVWKRFGHVVAVKDISFVARCGEVHALLGENGAGKSTLMGIASGTLSYDQGSIEICGQSVDRFSAAQAQRLGLAIVHQHPAVLPDLTVAENLLLAVPAALRTDYANANDWVIAQLRRVGSAVHPKTRLCDVDIAQSQLIELAKALAINPKILILDEPTAALTADLVDILFRNVREAATRGAAVIYISHRLQEIRQIADTVTVMRDGEVKGSAPVRDVSDDQILNLIVGRTVTKQFPLKSAGVMNGASILEVKGLSGADFVDINMSARGGEIVGIAGITGNGQSDFLRSLAGLGNARGAVTLDGKTVPLGNPGAARSAGIIYLSPDRQHEGLFPSLSVRENGTISALSRFANFGVVDRPLERRQMEAQRVDLNIRAASIEQNVATLSGGNQQKTILSRALLAEASLVLAEEPTAGVDVGARAEIYRILRDVASRGTLVVIVSSDIVELEGVCDRVLVFSRGHVVGELSGQDVNEANIGRTMITATTHRNTDQQERDRFGTTRSWLRMVAAGDYVPSFVLAGLIVLLGVVASGHNIRFVSGFNIEKILFLSAALAFVSFGQMCAVFTGRIDLSVGPLIGLSLVIASFFLNEGAGMATIIVGVLAVFGAAALVGLTNGTLVRFGNFTSVAATLGVYIIIQGISVLLRPYPDGAISATVMDTIKATIGSIPVVFIVALVLAIILEVGLRYSRWGMSLRAVGSNEKAAAHIGVRTGWTVVGAFIACSLLTALGGLMVVAQLGIGDPNQGIEYTLGSIAAVVLGGASLFGGRGSFIGVLLGAVLIQEVNSSMVFLGLSQAWQYWFIGLLTLIAVAVYSQARSASIERP
ncbi:ATP-binding cassette domain-containing protein [Mesorhizobium sp.]|uniref:ATP-binding cassette domain-containing protein n=1 Tax=Mesorhizobium sp. TaxID=1871066 RepID=UPI0025D1A844|nr:ATP-binding cassette domain-containing protein [Mesorhizobium sp.]